MKTISTLTKITLSLLSFSLFISSVCTLYEYNLIYFTFGFSIVSLTYVGWSHCDLYGSHCEKHDLWSECCVDQSIWVQKGFFFRVSFRFISIYAVLAQRFAKLYNFLK